MPVRHPSLPRLFELLRAGIAGAAATLVDIGVLAFLSSVLKIDPHSASIPALLAGGVANFIGNRHFAFRARGGSIARQALGYTVVEIAALVFNGLLYELALRTFPAAAAEGTCLIVRLVTSHIVFLAWSYPLWRKVFAVRPVGVSA